MNDKVCRELGYTREELLSLTVQDINPNATEAALKEVARLCNQAGFALLESVHRRKDGSVFPVEINIKPVTLDDRRYYVSVCRDITERKRAEELSPIRAAACSRPRKPSGLASRGICTTTSVNGWRCCR